MTERQGGSIIDRVTYDPGYRILAVTLLSPLAFIAGCGTAAVVVG